MATHDDLDQFFKKKDRKGKKQPTLLTNNEELLKRLSKISFTLPLFYQRSSSSFSVIATSATSAFKENFDFDDENQVEPHRGMIDENLRDPTDENSSFHQAAKIKGTSTKKSQPVSQIDLFSQVLPSNQQDEWEDFEGGRDRYDQIRLKLNPNHTAEDQNDADRDENDDDLFDGRDDDDQRDEDGNQSNNHHASKDKPVWKLDQVQATSSTQPVTLVEETPQVKPAAPATYRPPQLRGSNAAAGVTIVSGIHQRTTKKEKPNLASTEEFPTLGRALNKK